MGRSYAQLHTSIWSDRDFCALPGYVQRVYLLLISQPTVSYAGVLAYTERRFAAMSEDATKGEIADAMCVLEDRGYIVADEETEEVWVRSWCRYNGVLDHPNLRKAMASAYEDVLSPGVKAAIFAEYNGTKNVLLTTPAEPEATPSRTRREPDGSASVRVTSREDLEVDLQVEQEGERGVAADLVSSKDPAKRAEVDGVVSIFAATYGVTKVQNAVDELLAKPARYAFASDVRKALAAVLGSPPLDAKPHALDETAAAARRLEAEGNAYMEDLAAIPVDPQAKERIAAIRAQTRRPA